MVDINNVCSMAFPGKADCASKLSSEINAIDGSGDCMMAADANQCIADKLSADPAAQQKMNDAGGGGGGGSKVSLPKYQHQALFSYDFQRPYFIDQYAPYEKFDHHVFRFEYGIIFNLAGKDDLKFAISLRAGLEGAVSDPKTLDDQENAIDAETKTSWMMSLSIGLLPVAVNWAIDKDLGLFAGIYLGTRLPIYGNLETGSPSTMIDYFERLDLKVGLDASFRFYGVTLGLQGYAQMFDDQKNGDMPTSLRFNLGGTTVFGGSIIGGYTF